MGFKVQGLGFRVKVSWFSPQWHCGIILFAGGARFNFIGLRLLSLDLAGHEVEHVSNEHQEQIPSPKAEMISPTQGL